MHLPAFLCDPFPDRMTQWEMRCLRDGQSAKIIVACARVPKERRL